MIEKTKRMAFTIGLTLLVTQSLFALNKNNLIVDLEAPVTRWDEGIPLGNGGAGALLWGSENTLNITLDRADFWHNIDTLGYQTSDFSWRGLGELLKKKDVKRRRFVFGSANGISATKLPGVRLVLTLAPDHKLKRFMLESDSATAKVIVKTPSGEKEMLFWFDDGDELLSAVIPEGVVIQNKSFVNNPSFAKLGGYPEPEITMTDEKIVYRRLRRQGANNRFDRDFTAGLRFRAIGTKMKSEFWEKFNSESSVSIPDAQLQRLYDFTIYLYGAGAREKNPPIALQGLWTADNGGLPPWQGDYHNDLNTEMTYWAAGPAGHIEALEAFADFFIERLDEWRAFSKKIFEGGKGAVIVPTSGYGGHSIGGWTAYIIMPTHGLWVFQTFCDAYDYDPTPEKAAKYLAFGRELALGMENAWKIVDGVRVLDFSCSPEVENDSDASFLTPNSTYDRAILNSFYTRLSGLAIACGYKDEAEKWRSYVGTFGKPNVTKDGIIEISAGKSLSYSHRHPSHLMEIFPLINLGREPGVNYRQSLTHWEHIDEIVTKKKVAPWWCGYSYSWAGCFEARLGDGDRAYNYLKDFARAFVSRNGFHLNGDQLKCGLSQFLYRPFTLEGNFGYARAIQEMLLSYDPVTDTYRLFPAVPKAWDGKEISFTNLRIPGGHRISAKRDANGKITHTLVPYKGAKKLPKLARN